jgi:hypothetical protein
MEEVLLRANGIITRQDKLLQMFNNGKIINISKYDNLLFIKDNSKTLTPFEIRRKHSIIENKETEEDEGIRYMLVHIPTGGFDLMYSTSPISELRMTDERLDKDEYIMIAMYNPKHNFTLKNKATGEELTSEEIKSKLGLSLMLKNKNIKYIKYSEPIQLGRMSNAFVYYNSMMDMICVVILQFFTDK